MADDPAIDRDLSSVKDRGFTLATVTYEKFKSSDEDKHRVRPNNPNRLADPWEGRKFHHRLDSAWWKPPFEGKGGKILFPVEEKKVPSGDGSVQIKWTVWANPKDMNTVQVELYAVMRAEERYISEGYKKIASKYYSEPRGLPTEACGLDSFFTKGKQYLVCESKFTSDEGKFAKLKADETNVWRLLTKRNGVRQMSWEWIEDRVLRAVQDPPVVLAKRTEQQKDAVRDEVAEMGEAVWEEKIKRVVNVYGSAKVPIYPGRYKIRCGERAKVSKNVLHLQWKLEIDDAEFITLGSRFDKWVDQDS